MTDNLIKTPLNCLFINCQQHDEYYLSFPIGLATIAAITKSLGHIVQVVDFDVVRVDDKEEHLSKAVITTPDLVLLSGLITNFNRIKSLAMSVRRLYRSAIIILGGSLATTAPDVVLNDIEADIFVIGEGDETIRLLLHALSNSNNISGIKGLKFKSPTEDIVFTGYSPPPDLTNTPMPLYGSFPMEDYIRFFRKYGYGFEIYTSKGCPSSCVYCYSVSGKKVRYRPVESVITEIEHVKSVYGFDYFSIVDDCFLLDKTWSIAFMKRLQELKVSFRFQALTDVLTKYDLNVLHQYGLVGVSFGIESANTEILKSMKKRMEPMKATKLIKRLKDLEIRVNASFILGMPLESSESIEDTKTFLINSGFTDNFQLFFISVYPGTELYRWALLEGIIQDELDYVKNLGLQDQININLTKYSDSQVLAWRQHILDEVARATKNENTAYSGVTWKKDSM